jgi:hypothetical protein
MSIKLKGRGIVKLSNPTLADYPLALSKTNNTVLVSGTATTTVVVADAVYQRYSNALYYQGGAIKLTGGDAELVNLNPEIAIIRTDGTITRLSAGFCRVLAKGGVTVSITVDLNNTTSSVVDTYLNVLAGSLAEHCQTMIDNRISSSMTMEANGKIYTSQNHTTQTYVRNPNVWCADIDLTCISPWNSEGGVTRAGTLVTPRHVINAKHYTYNVGATVRFVAMDGTVYNRTVTGKANHASKDLTIYTLDSDLPVAITHCKLMSPNWSSYLVNNLQNRPPALGLDQEEKALIIDWRGDGSFLTPIDAARIIFDEEKINGDSGNPAFLIVNDELVLITVWRGGGAGSGDPVASYISDLNSLIVSADTQAGVSTGYTVTAADFSAFPNF